MNNHGNTPHAAIIIDVDHPDILNTNGAQTIHRFANDPNFDTRRTPAGEEVRKAEGSTLAHFTWRFGNRHSQPSLYDIDYNPEAVKIDNQLSHITIADQNLVKYLTKSGLLRAAKLATPWIIENLAKKQNTTINASSTCDKIEGKLGEETEMTTFDTSNHTVDRRGRYTTTPMTQAFHTMDLMIQELEIL